MFELVFRSCSRLHPQGDQSNCTMTGERHLKVFHFEGARWISQISAVQPAYLASCQNWLPGGTVRPWRPDDI